MFKKWLAMVTVLALLLPAAALGESTALPFGLQFGMDKDQTLAAFDADATLGKLKYDTDDYDNGAIEYNFEDIAVPGTDLTADSLSVQVDQNNSAKTDKLTSVGFVMDSVDNSIATFRTLLKTMSATLGAPESDPFSADATNTYVEWGTLDATWALEDGRISLSLSRMYEESISIQYTSRLNYDAADLAE